MSETRAVSELALIAPFVWKDPNGIVRLNFQLRLPNAIIPKFLREAHLPVPDSPELSENQRNSFKATLTLMNSKINRELRDCLRRQFGSLSGSHIASSGVVEPNESHTDFHITVRNDDPAGIVGHVAGLFQQAGIRVENKLGDDSIPSGMLENAAIKDIESLRKEVWQAISGAINDTLSFKPGSNRSRDSFTRQI